MPSIQDLLASFGGGAGAQKNLGILQSLGLGGDEYSSPIGPTAGTGAPMGQINPALLGNGQASQNSTNWAEAGGALSALGRGLSAGGDPSATPVDFGQALGQGTKELENYQGQQLKNSLTGAQTQKALQGSPDEQYTAALQRKFGGQSQPGDDAIIGAQNAQNQTKLTYTQDKLGNFLPQPAARDITSMLPGAGGGQAPRAQPNMQDPEFRAFLHKKYGGQ